MANSPLPPLTGDQQRLVEAYMEFAEMLARVARRRTTAHSVRLEDWTAGAYLGLCRAAATYQGEEDDGFKRWVRRCVRSELTNIVREINGRPGTARQRVRTFSEVGDAVKRIPAKPQPEWIVGQALELADEVACRTDRGRVHAIFTARLQALTQAEIGRHLGVTQQNVSLILARCREQLVEAGILRSRRPKRAQTS